MYTQQNFTHNSNYYQICSVTHLNCYFYYVSELNNQYSAQPPQFKTLIKWR